MFKNLLQGFRRPVLLLEKATSKKSIWIPQFTKKNGQVVGGHYALVHVTDDHDDHKVAHGEGSYSQKKAHAALKDDPAFQKLEAKEKAAVVMHHATEIQDKESATARLATLRKKLIAGAAPTPGEWKYFHAATAEKKAEIQAAVHAAGKSALMDSLYAQYVAKHPQEAAEAAKQSHAAETKATQEKAATAPQTPSFAEGLGGLNNIAKKAEAAIAAGDVEALEKMAVSLGHFMGDMLPEAQAPAQQLHDYLQSAIAHVKAKGEAPQDKKSTTAKFHADLKAELGQAPAAAPADKKADAAAKAAQKAEKKQQAIAEYHATHEKLGTASAHVDGKDWFVLAVGAEKGGKVYAHLASKTDGVMQGNGFNPAQQADYIDPALIHDPKKAAAAASQASTGLAMPEFSEGKEAKGVKAYYEKAAQKVIDAAAAGDAAALEAMPNPSKGNSWKGKTANSKALLALHAAALAHAKGEKPADVGPKEGDTKEGADGTLVLKDGHWIKQGEQAPAAAAPPAPAPAPAAELPAAPAAAPDAHAKQALINSFHDAKVTLDNTNAKSFNPKVDAIAAALAAGDEAALLAMNFGTNTYGKKAAKMANEALAFLGSTQTVSTGQKAGAHPALLLVKKGAKPTPDAPAAAAPAAAALPPVPVGLNAADTAMATEAMEAVQAGDLGKIKEMQKYAHDSGLVGPEAWAYIDKLAAHVSANGAPAPAPAAAPALPGGLVEPGTAGMTETQVAVMKDITEKLVANDLAGLEMLHASITGLKTFAPHETYLSTAIEHLEGNNKQEKQQALISGWIAAIGSGKAPSKQQADAMEAAMQSDTDSHAEAWAEAMQELAYAMGMDPESDVDIGKVDATVAQMHKLALAGPAAAGGEQAGPDDAKGFDFDDGETEGGPKMTGNPALDDPAADGEAGAAEEGPKEGDMKQGADGMLVFKNGRWHKAGIPSEDWKETALSIPLPKLAGKNSILMGKVAKHLQHVAAKEGAEGLAKFMYASKAPGKIVVKGGDLKGFALHQDGTSGTANGNALAKYATALQAAMGGAIGQPAAAPAAPTATKAAPKVAGEVESADGWAKTAGQKGYNEGGFYTDHDGQQWYVKFPAGGDAVIKNELLANKLYAAAGVATPEVKLVTMGGKAGLASKIIAGAQENKAALLSGKPKGMLEAFAVHAWLANWDAVGNNPAKGFDNILVDAAGKAHHIDQGGAMAYGGAGGTKQQFGEKVIELQTMLNPAKNANTAAVFGKLTPGDIAASIKKVAKISDAEIAHFCMKYGPGSDADKQALAKKLIARKQSMLSQYPQVVVSHEDDPDDFSWVRLGEGEKLIETGNNFGVKFAKIEVPPKGFDAKSIQEPWVYDKSSKAHVNAQNTADIAAIYQQATSGQGVEALAAMTFQAVDKHTGELGAKKPFSQHPSAFVREYYDSVLAEMQAQMQPTTKIITHGSIIGGIGKALRKISQAHKRVGYEKFKEWKKKAADYLIIATDGAAGLPVPEPGQFKEVSPGDVEIDQFKAASNAAFTKLNSAEKGACVSYTGSAYDSWNSAMRKGDVDSAAFKQSQPMREAFDKAAVDLPAGTVLWRGIGVGEETYKSALGAVVQDGSFQSSSYGEKPAFSSYGTWMRLNVGEGVKAVHATSFSKFGTGEREIIIDRNVRYAVIGVKHYDVYVDSKGNKHHNKTIVDVMVLPHED